MAATHALDTKYATIFPFETILKASGAVLSFFFTSIAIWMVRQPTSRNFARCSMLPDRVYRLCSGDKTVSSELAKDPTQAPSDIFHRLYSHPEQTGTPSVEADSLQKAAKCGNWGDNKPSDLFLKIYHDALCTLQNNPLSGVVSPPLMGSHGTIPLTIVAPLPDLCRHMANCIARAEKEVFLATNFWIHSDASTLITNALRELSRRAGARGERAVVKVIYDRGNPRQVYDNHLSVPEKKYTTGKVRLPSAEEIPNIDMQVINYHRPVLGTFHAKFMIVDRREALVQSSNIQDNDNLEMMVRLEGPIVDSIYDTAVISWGRSFDTPLPMLSSPAAGEEGYEAVPEYVNDEDGLSTLLKQHTTKHPHYDPDLLSEVRRVNSALEPSAGESKTQAATKHLNTTIQHDTTGDAPDSDQELQMKPYILTPPHNPVPIALVNREPWGAPNHTSIYTPQNAAWLSAIQNAQHSIFIQTPNMNAEPIIQALLEAARRGVVVTCYVCLGYNDAGQLLPFQNGTNEMIANRMYRSLDTDEERSRLRIFNYVGKDQTRPIHNRFKRRSCHIKLMIIDEMVAIQGNGNLDTRSFYHSQEVNILVDSALVCRTWLEIINRNQNTATYGAVSSEDGCWHDPVTGELATGSIGVNPGRFSWAKGMFGAVQRDIVNYIFHYQIDDQNAYRSARGALLDAIGCAIETASKSKECESLLGPVIPGTTVPNGFKVPGTTHQLDPVKGAFDLGVLIRYLDHNDALGGAEWGHPSDNLAAILAVLDWLSRESTAGDYTHIGPPLTMRTLLTALIKAYEIQGCYQMRNSFNQFGIDHVILVKLASAAVVSWLLGLTEEQTMATISHVWMDGHPSRVYRSGTNTIPRKGWAAGDASMRAVHLALLVRAGQPGAPGALSAPPSGFLQRTFGDKGFELPRPFGTWTIQHVLFKVMPVEGHGISAVEAALVQRQQLQHAGIGPQNIQRMHLRTTEAAALIINKQGLLHNAADRDHCIQYLVALALLKGQPPEVEDYQDGSRWANSEELTALRNKIIVRADDKLTSDYHDLDKKSIGSALAVDLRNGSSLSEVTVEYPVGHVQNPRTADAVHEKFWKNMRLMFSEGQIREIVRATEDGDMKINDFVDLISPQQSSRCRF
ncbi:phospholipase D Active site motif protein [Aspergillus terreus]|uniref:Phospholipase D Active site motif protein n=1 Tax=Aspergillus terreus TaxID=33178 RepID=A0A8H3MMS4_ASPTE|nr:phospholipase D Active site motif protein [Aspergillus terreus]